MVAFEGEGDGVADFFGKEALAEWGFVGDDVFFGIRVPGAEDGEGVFFAGRFLDDVDDGADADGVVGSVGEISEAGFGNFCF